MSTATLTRPTAKTSKTKRQLTFGTRGWDAYIQRLLSDHHPEGVFYAWEALSEMQKHGFTLPKGKALGALMRGMMHRLQQTWAEVLTPPHEWQFDDRLTSIIVTMLGFRGMHPYAAVKQAAKELRGKCGPELTEPPFTCVSIERAKIAARTLELCLQHVATEDRKAA